MPGTPVRCARQQVATKTPCLVCKCDLFLQKNITLTNLTGILTAWPDITFIGSRKPNHTRVHYRAHKFKSKCNNLDRSMFRAFRWLLPGNWNGITVSGAISDCIHLMMFFFPHSTLRLIIRLTNRTRCRSVISESHAPGGDCSSAIYFAPINNRAAGHLPVRLDGTRLETILQQRRLYVLNHHFLRECFHKSASLEASF